MNFSNLNSRKLAWGIWVIASIFYAYQYILRVMPSILIDDIMQQFGMSTTTFGQFSGIYYIGYSLMHLPIGIMLDRYGPKRVMTGCILLTVIGLMPILLAEHWIYPIVGRLLIGIGSSAAILGIFKIIRVTFSEERFPRMLSLSVMIGLVGAIYGGGPVNYMNDIWGYQIVIQSLAIGGAVLAIITYFIVPEIKTSFSGSVTSNLREVMGNGKVILTCLFAGAMVGPLEGFADVWGSVFLKQLYSYEGTMAASMPSMIFIGMCFGAPLLTMIADKIKSYLLTIVGAGVFMAVCFVTMLAFEISAKSLTVNFIIVGVCSAYQILAIYKASTYAREEVASLTTALANMIIMIFGYAFHSAIGSIVSAMGGPSEKLALVYGISVIPITLCIGTVGFLWLHLREKATSPKLAHIE